MITADDVSVEVRAVRLTDGRVAAALAPTLAPLLGMRDSVAVDVTVVEPAEAATTGTAGTASRRSRRRARTGAGQAEAREDLHAMLTVERSGRAWTEARTLLRERRGWARRATRSPIEIVLLTPSDEV